MAVLEKVFLFGGVFGKQEHFGTSLFGCSDDVVDLASRVVRQFRVDMEVGSHGSIRPTGANCLTLSSVLFYRVADRLEILASESIDRILDWSILGRFLLSDTKRRYCLKPKAKNDYPEYFDARF